MFDVEDAAPFELAPGAETDVVFDTAIEPDVEQKVYPGQYVVRMLDGSSSGGQANFTVNGIALTVEASLDQPAYADGDTAHLTVEISNGTGAASELVARVHYADFEDERPLSLAGSSSTVFDVPLPKVTGEPLFLGIAHPDGRSLYINTYNLRRADNLVLVTLDAQVYAPGSTVTISATPAAGGTLTLFGPGYSETIEAAGSVTRSFALDADLPAGTQFVTWDFTAADGRSAAGSVPFDVSGLRVRVFEASLDEGRYASGDVIESTLRINSNQPAAALLRGFILDPEGLFQPVGATTVTLDPAANLYATSPWPFSSAIAGLHRFVFGLYQPASDALLASGSLGFDVGNAAVLGLRTDKADYPLPTEPVTATVSAFVSGPATLRLDLDGQEAASQEVAAGGIAEIPVTLPSVEPGPHRLEAVMEGAGYTSRGSASFTSGTSLPDLVAGLPLAGPGTGASWAVDVGVSNVGRNAAPGTSLDVRDPVTGSLIGTAPVPALGAGASATVSVPWDVLGGAGSRQVQAVADAGAAVAEYREDNNVATASVDVPALVMQAISEPSYPANADAVLGARLLNLTGDVTYSGLSLLGSVARPDGSIVGLPPAAFPPVAPESSSFAAVPWAVGTSAPGLYVLQVTAIDSGGASLAQAEAGFNVLPTVALAGTVAPAPNPAPAGGALSLTGHIQNQGNVLAAGEAVFDVVDAEGTVAVTRSAPAAVPLAGATDVTVQVDPLDVNPGEYRVELGLDVEGQEYPVASAPLSVTGAGVTATMQPELSPRVLAFVGGLPLDPAGNARRVAFVNASLAGSGAIVKTTSSLLEFGRLARSGAWNTYVLINDVPLPLLLVGEELREAVFRGDGLVLVQWRSGPTPSLEPALEARIAANQGGTSHTLHVLETPLGPAQTLVVPGLAAKIQLQGATLAATMDPSLPALSAASFGLGRTVTMSFDPAVDPASPVRPALQALFARSVAYVAPEAPRQPSAGRVLAMAVRVDNSGSTARSVEVTLDLPEDVRLAAADDAPTTTNPVEWDLVLPGGGASVVRFAVALPDSPGLYDVGATVRVDGLAINPVPHATFAVPATSAALLDQAVASLRAVSVSSSEQAYLDTAVTLLALAQALPGTTAIEVEVRIQLAAAAGLALDQIHSADVSMERSQVDLVLAAWERAWYDSLGTT